MRPNSQQHLSNLVSNIDKKQVWFEQRKRILHKFMIIMRFSFGGHSCQLSLRQIKNNASCTPAEHVGEKCDHRGEHGDAQMRRAGHAIETYGNAMVFKAFFE